jgi:hypothetical protein
LVNAGLAAVVTEAFALRNHLLSGSDDSIEAMSGRLGMNKGRLTSLIRLSHLAPEILGALLAGGSKIPGSVARHGPDGAELALVCLRMIKNNRLLFLRLSQLRDTRFGQEILSVFE